eukprot:4576868-Alexandrium_andersonii.AAC.1
MCIRDSFFSAAATWHHSAANCAGSATRPGCRAPRQASGGDSKRLISPASCLCPTRSLSKELPM